MSGFALGSKEMTLHTSYAIIDTGSSYNMVPSSDFNQMLNVWKKSLTCAKDNYGYYVCGCTQT